MPLPWTLCPEDTAVETDVRFCSRMFMIVTKVDKVVTCLTRQTILLRAGGAVTTPSFRARVQTNDHTLSFGLVWSESLRAVDVGLTGTPSSLPQKPDRGLPAGF